MASERVQRQIDRLLDEAEEAFAKRDCQVVRDNARDVIGLDPVSVAGVAGLDDDLGGGLASSASVLFSACSAALKKVNAS